MYNEIGVEKAINRGKWLVNITSMGIVVFALVLFVMFPLLNINIMFISFAIPVGILIAIIYRGFMVTYWRLWAFERVRNVHELKHRAEQVSIILGTGERNLGKMEFRTSAQNARWDELLPKFKTSDLLVDDPDLADEHRIHFSQLKKVLIMLMSILCIGFGLALIFMPQKEPFSFSAIWGYVFGTFIVFGMCWLFYDSLKGLRNRAPQIILNNNGLQTSDTYFYSWAEISDEKVISRGTGKSRSSYLIYDIQAGRKEFYIDDFDLSAGRIDRLLRAYRSRYEHRNGGEKRITNIVRYGNFFTLLFVIIILDITTGLAQGQPLKISPKPVPGAFPLITSGKVATIVTDDDGVEVTGIAARALKNDLMLLCGLNANIVSRIQGKHMPVVIGTLGKSKIIDQLASKKLIPATQIKDKWETFCLTVIKNPKDPGSNMLVIFGSDPRGTAFGVFEFSKMLGVSPWVWWADVKPQPVQQIFVTAGKSIVGPPSVKYRGFFINDEDWGIRPWAAKNMDKDLKDIGPRTYEKVFELMLRLKANYLWPAMHPGTKAFWYYKENPVLARKYGIIMGSSHHEPMLRDTEFEWNENFREEYGKDHGEWRYDTNKDEIYHFFDDRVKQSVNNEAIYTVGMRATKDGSMEGAGGMQGKIKILEEVIRDQRQILQHRLEKPANQIPQVFCPYKEVLEMYQAGLQVPEDVTITWVDDNHGYIRQLPDPQEQQRIGGGGVYYHFSYWGLPQDYLWLSSTSPVLTSFEMSKAYALNARKIWMFNAGDIKPAELELEFGMDLAWDVNSWTPEKAHKYAANWAGRTFGQQFGKRIGNIKSRYYLLAASGKPEHLSGTDFTPLEIAARLKEYNSLVQESRLVGKLIPERLQDAYFQLVSYPVEAACSMNEKIFYSNESLRLSKEGNPQSPAVAQKAKAAYANIAKLSQRYNHEIANGKWEGMMDDHPRGRDIFNMPDLAKVSPVETTTVDDRLQTKYRLIFPADAYQSLGNDNGKFKTITGLGSSGKGLTRLPMEIKTFSEKDINNAPFAEYQIPVKKGRNFINVKCLPTFPIYNGMKLRYAISINGSRPVFMDIATLAETKIWSLNVLRGFAMGETAYDSKVDKKVEVRIYFPDPGLVLNAVSVYNRSR